MKTIVILLDTLIRKHLPMYGGDVATPNMQKIADQSVVFNNCYIGSAPCMPARRDLFTGRLEFLERPWGALEPFDHTFVQDMRAKKIFTHMITDHYHYFEKSGEHYCQCFNTWDFIRGQENDCWASVASSPRRVQYPGLAGYSAENDLAANDTAKYGVHSSQYQQNRKKFIAEGAFPVKTLFENSAKWLKDNADCNDFLLMVEGFSPHEPFEVPQEVADRNGGNGEFIWTSYNEVTEPQQAIKQLGDSYRSILSYTDSCLGELLEAIEETGGMDDYCIILTTDHGHLLGEHGYTGKNVMPMYQEIAHIPLFIHLPGQKKAARSDAMVQLIDIYPTLAELYGFKPSGQLHGRSLVPILHGKKGEERVELLFGVFGLNVNMTDGRHVFMKAHEKPNNSPLYAYTATPSTFKAEFANEEYFKLIECGHYLDYTNLPVYKLPIDKVWQNDKSLRYTGEDRLYNIVEDYEQQSPITDSRLNERYKAKLISLMELYGAPAEQFERLGLDEHYWKRINMT